MLIRRHPEAEEGKKPRLVPWKEVEETLDMSRQYRLRIVSVLKLSEEAQQLIDDYNLAEATIRPVVQKLKEYPDLQVRALRQLIAWQQAEESGEGGGRRIVPSMRALVERLQKAREAPAGGQSQPQALDFGKFRRKVRGTLGYMKKLDNESMTELSRILDNDAGGDILQELQALRDRVDEMLARLMEEKD